MSPDRAHQGHSLRSSRHNPMAAPYYSDSESECLELLYPAAGFDFESSLSRSPSSPSSPSFVHAMDPDVVRIISYSPAAMKYLPEIKPINAGYKTTSHSAKRDPEHTPRPPNAFLIYRSWFCATGDLNQRRQHNILSKQAGAQWKVLSDSEKAPFELAACLVKERHALLYPAYKYSPTADKRARKSSAQGKSRSKASSSKHSRSRRSSKASLVSLSTPSCSSSTFSGDELSQFSMSFASNPPSSLEDLSTFVKLEQISPLVLPEPLVAEEPCHMMVDIGSTIQPFDMAVDIRALVASREDATPCSAFDIQFPPFEDRPYFPSLSEASTYPTQQLTPPLLDVLSPEQMFNAVDAAYVWTECTPTEAAKTEAGLALNVAADNFFDSYIICP